MDTDQQAHPDQARRPLALTVLALLLIAIGVIGLANLILRLFNGPGAIDFNAFAILPGMGLLRRSPGWRRFTLIVTWFNLAMLALAVALHLRDPNINPITIEVGSKIMHPPPLVVWGCTAVVAFLLIWTLRVLMRPDVRQLFRETDPQQEARG